MGLFQFLIIAYPFTFNSTSRFLDDLLNIDKAHFEQMVDRIYLLNFN